MSATEATPRSALVRQDAAEGRVPSVTFEQMERMAQSIAKSNLFGVKNADQALALMMIAQAEGKHPALIARDFDIIQGRPSKKSEAILRDFIAAGGTVEWHDLSDTLADATFSHPSAVRPVRISWDLKRAETAKLMEKAESMYHKYPRAMLRSRCISEGCRTVYPGSTSGMYTPEEGHDIPEERIVASVDQAVKDAHEAAVNALTESERTDHLTAIRDATSTEELTQAFATAWTHAGKAKDTAARDTFKATYDARKAELLARATS